MLEEEITTRFTTADPYPDYHLEDRSAHTLVELSAKHVMFTTVKGRFKGVKGTIIDHEDDPKEGGMDEPHDHRPTDAPRVSREIAGEAVLRGEVFLLDVRTPEEYRLSHAPGAVNIPLRELADRLGELPRDRPIIAYCTWPHEASSARAAHFLNDRGFRASALAGGLHDWQAAGYALAGEHPGARLKAV